MYEIIYENNITYLKIESDIKLPVQSFDTKDDFGNTIFMTNSEIDNYKIDYHDIAKSKISHFPDSILILIKLLEVKLVETSKLSLLPYPFNDWVAFLKKDNSFSVIYISSLHNNNENSYKKWSPDYFHTQLLKMSDKKKISSWIFGEDGTLFEPGTCIIKIDTEQSETIESCIEETITALKDILFTAEASMSGLSKAYEILNTWYENQDNSSEEFWQNFLSEHSWVISQAFSLPLILFKDKVYMGGKGLDNTNGQIIDFVYKNDYTNNLTLIEIKTPITKLIGSKYRNVYSLSNELSGAVNQLLSYKDRILKDYYSTRHNTSEIFSLYNPKCLLIIGLIESLNQEERVSFELFRNELKSVEIITFDEIFKKVDYLLKLSIVDSV
ncbi:MULTISPECIES: Shedu immune nuclease family protein [Paenibacillus]|uniref:Shedu immune nuclease family protein n=2 Tax=Paenibacillus TaxID=44249 RepID=UPI0006969C5C|nr:MULTISPECIES: Shedu immune nuclease family protein [Paenibacillus]AUS27806.1 hypothetical protein C1A50_3642 [Paenibacillus polymyxa]KAF6585956.1 DUF4263 domain-containing protein [Paenibacillus sp. EKM211P]OMF43518.1 hypothetical protein BK135_17855 [Paenibacillus peoriae]WOZ37096.1 Shedu immune nuclease family protein [Paenibacillus polymyxa]